MTTAEGPFEAGRVETAARDRVRTWIGVALSLFLLNLAAYVGFTLVGGIFFVISDALALLLGVAMVPVVSGLPQALSGPKPSTVATRVGLAGAGLVGVGALILLASEVAHELVPGAGGLGLQFIGFSLIGVWLMAVGRSGRSNDGVSRIGANAALVAGVAFAVGILAVPLGPASPVVALAAAFSFGGFVTWSVVSRRDLATSQ